MGHKPILPLPLDARCAILKNFTKMLFEAARAIRNMAEWLDVRILGKVEGKPERQMGKAFIEVMKSVPSRSMWRRQYDPGRQ